MGYILLFSGWWFSALCKQRSGRAHFLGRSTYGGFGLGGDRDPDGGVKLPDFSFGLEPARKWPGNQVDDISSGTSQPMQL